MTYVKKSIYLEIHIQFFNIVALFVKKSFCFTQSRT